MSEFENYGVSIISEEYDRGTTFIRQMTIANIVKPHAITIEFVSQKSGKPFSIRGDRLKIIW